MPIISETDAAEFLSQGHTPDDLAHLTVPELRVICSLLNCGSVTSLTKVDLLNILIQRLFGETDIESEQDVNNSMITHTQSHTFDPESSDVVGEGTQNLPSQIDSDPINSNEHVRLRELELKIKLEQVTLDKQSLILDKQIQLATLNKSSANASSTSPAPQFDFSSAVKVMPRFSDANVDEFFSSFERLARVMHFPRKYWTVLLQQALTGKAQRVYASLSDSEAEDYDTLKEEILKAYSLVPEAYRKRFRMLHKRPEHTFLEFASMKRDSLNKWLKSKDVSSFDSLVNLILVEDFLRTVNRDVSLYLVDKECDTIEEAAKQADCYSLRHGKRINDNSNGNNPSHFQQQSPQRTTSPHFKSKDVKSHNVGTAPSKPSFTKSPSSSKRTCTFCGKDGHIATYCYRRLKAFEKPRPVMCACGSSIPSKTFSASSDASVLPVAKQNANNVQQNLSVASKSALSTVPQQASFASENALAPELSASAEKPVAFLAQPIESDAVSADKDPNLGTYEAFISAGTVSVKGNSVPVTVLRDTGSLQTLIRKGIVSGEPSGKYVVLSTLWGTNSAPLIDVVLDTQCYSGPATIAEVPQMPVPNVDVLLGNDLAGACIGSFLPAPIVQEQPESSAELMSLEKDLPDVFPLCAVTRSMTQARHSVVSGSEQREVEGDDTDLTTLFQPSVLPNQSLADTDVGRKALVTAQRDDESLLPLFDQVGSHSHDSGPTTTYFLDEGVLCRRWLPPNYPQHDAPWAAVIQIVAPEKYRKSLLELAHDGHLSGHFGVRKTQEKLLKHFFWPHLRKDVAAYVRSCYVCQKVGKVNSKIQVAPLIKVPHVPEPFSVVQIDVVGPLPKTTRGHQYILTLLDVATRYVHATPLRVITAKGVVKGLLDFFSHFGMPRRIQTDGASYFVGNVFKAALAEWGVSHNVSSPYHPQTQGAVERSHQTIKSILRKYALQFHTHWDDDLPYLLFAMREVPNESTGFSPSELVFAHEVRGPLHVIRDKLLERTEKSISLIDLISDVKVKMRKCRQLAEQQINQSKERTKAWYDKRARHREFKTGDKVLILLPLPGQPLRAKFSGPYEVIKKISPTNYIVSTPDRRRSQRLCHVNMMKEFHLRDSADPVPVAFVQASQDSCEEFQEEEDHSPLFLSSTRVWLDNSTALTEKLQHLSLPQRTEVLALFQKYQAVFSDKPGLTNAAVHDIDVGNAKPIKLAPYRVHPSRVNQIKNELEKMQEMNIIEPTTSEWCSPITLVPKKDGTLRFCVDYRKLNSVTKKNTFPLPRVEDCIEAIGNAIYLSKIDCLRGYWQVPLTSRAQEISAFVTLGRTFKFKVMPFGLCNAPATFQKLMSDITASLPNCVVYLDDIVVYSNSWLEHLEHLDALFSALDNANLVVNLTKSEFVTAQLQYLGHVIGLGTLAPPSSKCKDIQDISPPCNKRQVRRFLGTVGYYRRYISNFAELALPLTDLLKKGKSFAWTQNCQQSFQSLKNVLCSHPILKAPDFSSPFKISCDASDQAAGSVLLQEDDQGIDHPVAYYSKKFSPPQTRYATVEKELLSIILALDHFSYYLLPQSEIVVYTDHKPLQYLKNFCTKNQRLVRWHLFLQNYNLNIQHVKGEMNVLPDLLSRPMK